VQNSPLLRFTGSPLQFFPASPFHRFAGSIFPVSPCLRFAVSLFGGEKNQTVGITMSKLLIKVIAYLVTAAGLTVMLGWILDINLVTSLSPDWVSMKFSTALAFVLSGTTLYFLVRAQEGEFEKAQVALSITSLMLALLMGLMFFSALFGVQTGIEELVIRDPGDMRTVAPGRPSLPTMLNFILIALAAVLAILNPAKLKAQLRIIGGLMAAIGTVAVIGYLFNAPLLYYYLAGINSAMALHTALLFVLLGAGFLCL